MEGERGKSGEKVCEDRGDIGKDGSEKEVGEKRGMDRLVGKRERWWSSNGRRDGRGE